ncbi:MAG: prepilin-type N-terminal cleavage/methylation domain-containing protein [Thermoleophilia bacterium]|nr:prepilin-type N-terminal cleavage/methylation domain-containing protein [Thermoleophilia bacterium]
MLTGREQGFGLVELLVGMVIASIVLAAFLLVFRQALLRSSEVDSRAISAARLSEALDRLGDDVRSARKADRADIFKLSTRDELRAQLTANAIKYGDVAYAGGSQFAVWTDSDADPAGPRCATWRFEQVDDGATVTALVRRSGPPGGPCPNAHGTREVILTLGENVPVPPHAFRYGLLTPVSANTCSIVETSPNAPSMNPSQLLNIVSLTLDLSSGATRQTAVRRDMDARNTIDIWSRLNDDYYYALGCSA